MMPISGAMGGIWLSRSSSFMATAFGSSGSLAASIFCFSSTASRVKISPSPSSFWICRICSRR